MFQIFKLLKARQHSNINAKDLNGNTILHRVFKDWKITSEEEIKVLKILVDKGIDPNLKNNKNESVWHLAIANQSKEIIDFLLAREIHLDDSVALYWIETEHNKVTKWASQSQMSDNEIQILEKESASSIEWIISKDLNSECLNRLRMGIFLLAIDYHLQHILPALLNHTKEIDYLEYETERTLLHIFLENNASLRVTHQSRPTETWYDKYSQRYALNIVKILLDKGVAIEAVDKYGNTALHVAIKNKENIGIVEMLIERTKNVNCKNLQLETPFSIAIYKWRWSNESETKEYEKICRALIAKGADVNGFDKETSPLCVAVETLNLPAVELLRENFADFDVTTSSGRTLLHLLALGFDLKSTTNETMTKLFNFLIDVGYDEDEKDEDGETALHISAYLGDLTTTKLLIEQLADIEARNNRRETPLRHLAVDIFQTYTAELLLERGANVNSKDVEGYTTLHAVAVGSRTESSPEMLRLLLKYGADFSARVDAGHSVLHLALWKDYNDDEEYDHYKVEPDDLTSIRDCKINDASEEVEILLEHWIKLHVANLKCFIGFEYEELVAIGKYKKYEEKCLEEIKILKTTFIDSRMTLYNLLRFDLHRRRAYLKNEKLKQLLTSPEFEDQFPEYSVLIYASYREALIRAVFLRAAKEVWLYLTKINLLEICLEHVFSFLSNAELYEFIELY